MGLFAAAALVTAGVAATLAQQPRDGQRLPERAGTAAVTGIVLSTDSPSRPIRRARVTLNSPALPMGLAGITADDGRFRIERVPAGRYSVDIAKEAYLTTAYGARRPGRAGQPVVLEDGAEKDLLVLLQRGAVLSGTITDPEGQPLSGAVVTPHRYGYNPTTGERRLLPQSTSTSLTDDRGEYRVFGLPPGEYVISALVSSGPAVNLQVQSPADVRRALAEVTPQKPGAARVPGMPPPPPAPRPTPPGPPPRTVAYAPVFYPGSTRAADAWTVTLGPGEERRGLDVQVEFVPTASLSGTVLGPQGAAQNSSVLLMTAGARTDLPTPDRFMRVANPDGQGNFTFSAVPPGLYTLTARHHPSFAGLRSQAAAGSFASTTVLVDGDDITEVGLALQPGLSISGRVTFDGEKPAPPGFPALRASVPLQTAGGPPGILPTVAARDDSGGFIVQGLGPGTYRPSPNLQGIRSPLGGWWLQSIVLDGHDLLDGPFEISRGLDGVVVTFADRASELSGAVTDAGGLPVIDHHVIVFSADPAHWFPLSRRIAAVRLPPSGRYSVRNLPPGDYFIVVDDDVDPGQWFDPSYLGRMAGRASRVSLGPFEKSSHDRVIPSDNR